MCCEENLDPKSQKVTFEKNKFADSLWLGNLALYMPKPDKNNASNGLI